MIGTQDIGASESKLVIAYVEGIVALVVAVIGALISLYCLRKTNEHQVSILNLQAKKDADLLQERLKYDRLLEDFKAQLALEEKRINEEAPRRARLIEHIIRTGQLVDRTYSSFASFAKSRASLDPSDVLPRATDVLDQYADLRQHLNDPLLDSYPDDLKDSLGRGHQHLARLFLDLQFEQMMPNDTRSSDQRILETLSGLSTEQECAKSVIQHYTVIPLVPSRSHGQTPRN